jgi:hypothetical protein
MLTLTKAMALSSVVLTLPFTIPVFCAHSVIGSNMQIDAVSKSLMTEICKLFTTVNNYAKEAQGGHLLRTDREIHLRNRELIAFRVGFMELKKPCN